ncbi:hypothetical protein SERLADRAFT_412053 [Serpula lacrymans var. lacrymans S7.9]|uniref:Uncharacterized protein n=1 Tax=Serpula lacrymans var. lacrymans (strain S7.9) TaxID=578457 RepID=F8PDM4_SERL9|nr:uncharacterized protein SERLADRAFT_412053 [Serpula lacrymans var. lacrymans S7.9]EGO18845.1 hypothetical protein SERLADRAFT_412053 [Serpula lacrymans var. lacrymans S7.9]
MDVPTEQNQEAQPTQKDLWDVVLAFEKRITEKNAEIKEIISKRDKKQKGGGVDSPADNMSSPVEGSLSIAKSELVTLKNGCERAKKKLEAAKIEQDKGGPTNRGSEGTGGCRGGGGRGKEIDTEPGEVDKECEGIADNVSQAHEVETRERADKGNKHHNLDQSQDSQAEQQSKVEHPDLPAKLAKAEAELERMRKKVLKKKRGLNKDSNGKGDNEDVRKGLKKKFKKDGTYTPRKDETPKGHPTSGWSQWCSIENLMITYQFRNWWEFSKLQWFQVMLQCLLGQLELYYQIKDYL